jgi:SAM-dependent methyltransferase
LTPTPPLSLHAWLRFDAIKRLLEQHEVGSVLEIGAGQGSVGVFLSRQFDYTGLELDHESYETACARFRRYGIDPDGRLLHGGLELVEGRQFDVVCAFEVLEHFEQDDETLRSWGELVKPGGWVMVSVPAGAKRLGAADRKAGHYRRYDREDMQRLLDACGFGNGSVINYGFPVGYVLEHGRNLLARRALRRRLSYEERTRESGRWLQPPEAAALLMRASSAPFRTAQRPFSNRAVGTGLVAAGQRLA